MKKELENKLEKAGFKLFSEMSYEDYEPYEKKIECSDLTYVIMDCYNVYPYYVKKICDCLVIAAYVDEEADFNATSPRENKVDWIYTVIIPLEEHKLLMAFEETVKLYRHWNIPMKLGTISEKYKDLLEESELLSGKFHYKEQRSDYLYLIEDYIDINGGKNAKKRRDLNKIMTEYPDARVEFITDWGKAKPVIMNIMDEWCRGYDCEKCAYGCERKVIDYLLDSKLTGNLCGAIMYLGEEPEMFAIAQVIEDTCFLFFKKSVNRIHGAFYYFEYEFLKNLDGVRYVNFQEDLGLPGLREYKRRRHPIRMIDKYETGILYWNWSYATKDDWDELCILWSEAFGDSKEYVLQFLERFYTENNVFVWRENEKIVTALYDLPAEIVIPEEGNAKSVKAHYLYAITTKKEFRGRRILEKLLRVMKNELGNAILFLVPETEVIPYYQSLGFELQTATMGWEYFLKKMDEANEIEIEPLWSAEEYDNIRQVWLRRRMNETGQGFVLWDKSHLEWAFENIKMMNGAVYKITFDEKIFLLAGYIRKEDDDSSTFCVLESTIGDEDLDIIGADILQKINCSRLLQAPLQLMLRCKVYDKIYLAYPLG